MSDKYKLNEMPTASYPKRTEQNILESDGTLIFS
ncbi:MAG: putative molybdenum carrier protein [Deltaproteobacteria bacterium]|nr:putative molybdenum carrier protein [Deltaproteobacteria bacterium]